MARTIRTVWKYRWFVYYMTSKSHQAGLFRSMLGNLWLFLNPAAQMAIYWFLFVVIFGRTADGLNPVLVIVSGITHYLLLSQSTLRGASSLLGQESLLLQMRLEPLLIISTSFFVQLKRFGFALCIFAIYACFVIDWTRWQLLLYPVALLVILLTAGLLTTLAGILTVYLRDLLQFLPLAIRMNMYFAPVIYPITFVPDGLLNIYLYNPIACLYACLQWTLMDVPCPGSFHILNMCLFIVLLSLTTSFVYRKYAPGVTKAF